MKPNLKAFTLYGIIFYLVWMLRATIIYSAVDLALADETQRLIFANSVKFILWVFPAAIFIARVDQRPPLEVLKVTTALDYRGLFQAALIATLYFISVFGAEKYFIPGRTLARLWQASPLLWLATFAQVFFSPIPEELLLRGFVLSKLNEHYSFWLVNIVQSLLFTAMHLPNWIWVNGLQAGIIPAALGIFIIGLLLGWIVRRTNSIWPPVVVHISNNFLVAFLV